MHATLAIVLIAVLSGCGGRERSEPMDGGGGGPGEDAGPGAEDAGSACLDEDGCAVCGLEEPRWAHPLPSGDDLRAAWPLPDGGAVAVGGRSVFVYDGTTWSLLPEPPAEVLALDVWASAPDDIWIASREGVHRWDGESWQLQHDGSVSLVWGSGPADVWVFGAGRHWDGSEWTSMGAGISFADALWGSGPEDVWLVGDGGAVGRFDGSEWIRQSVPTSADLRVVTGSGSDDVWIGGERGALLRRTGGTWHSFADVTSRDIVQIVARPDGTALVVDGDRTVHRFDGTTWVTGERLEFSVSDLVSLSGGDLLAVGQRGLRARGDGASWTFDQPSSPRSVVAFASGDTRWALASTRETSRVLREEGAGWVEALEVPVTHGGLAAAGRRAWIAGAGGAILAWDGEAWSAQDSGARSDFFFAWARSEDEAYAVGPSMVATWDGSSWTPHGQPHVTIEGATVTADGTLLGYQEGAVMVWSGGRFTELLHLPSGDVQALWGASIDDLWIYALDGLTDGNLYRRRGERLERLDDDCAPPHVNRMTGTGPEDVWFVTSVIHHWDGETFRRSSRLPLSATVAVADSDGLWLGASSEGIVTVGREP